MGRGFAVVADEVRKLAERTQNATLDIEQKIRLIVDGTNQALLAMRDGNQQMQAGRDNSLDAQRKLSGIIGETGELASLLSQMSQAEANQNRGFAQFASDITAVGESTRSLSGETQAIADAIARLDHLLEDLGQSARICTRKTPRHEKRRPWAGVVLDWRTPLLRQLAIAEHLQLHLLDALVRGQALLQDSSSAWAGASNTTTLWVR